jgi:hypothetical protein
MAKAIPTFVIPRPSKIYPNCDFWYENIPSGNPGSNPKQLIWNAWVIFVVINWSCLADLDKFLWTLSFGESIAAVST